VKTKTENKTAAKILKRQSKYFLSYHTGKRLQTANNTLLGVFPIYKVLAYVPNKENGCKGGFEGCKGAKIGQNI
jgi:hypothetical protein